jgi:hypothetical protein
MLNCTESHAEKCVPDLNEHSTFCEKAASLDNGLSYSTVKKLPPLQEAEHRSPPVKTQPTANPNQFTFFEYVLLSSILTLFFPPPSVRLPANTSYQRKPFWSTLTLAKRFGIQLVTMTHLRDFQCYVLQLNNPAE